MFVYLADHQLLVRSVVEGQEAQAPLAEDVLHHDSALLQTLLCSMLNGAEPRGVESTEILFASLLRDLARALNPPIIHQP